MERDKRIFGLDLMRVAAIALVIVAQCIWIFPQAGGVVSQFAALFHYLGLEIFFVLCGFLIGNAIYPIFRAGSYRWKSVTDFLKRRAIRILPLYFLILLVNFFIASLIGYPVEQGWKYFFFLQNFASPMPAFFSESWGLPIIVFAMVLFPVVLFLLDYTTRPKNKSMLFLLTTLLLIFVFLILKGLYNLNTGNTSINEWDASLKSVLVYRLDSVYIGVLLSWLVNAYPSFINKLRIPLALFGGIGIAFIFVGVGYFRLLIENHQLFWNVWYLPLTSLSVALFLPFLNRWRNSLLKKPVAVASYITYAVYLLHFGVVLQLMKYYFPPAVSHLGFVIIYLILVFILAGTTQRLYRKIVLKVLCKPSRFH